MVSIKYDIVPIKKIYRGIDRSLLATDILTPKTRKEYNNLLDMYYSYLLYIEESVSDLGLKRLIDFYKILMGYGICCEIIIYDINPLKMVYGYKTEFLGIDIVRDMSESLISEEVHSDIQTLLNENGLCKEESDVDVIIPLLNHGKHKWVPCYVYKLKIELL